MSDAFEPTRSIQALPRVEILGVLIHDLSPEELISRIEHFCLADERVALANVNIHAMNIALKEASFKQYLNGASINFCDGVGVQLGARILGKEIRHRLTPPDWIAQLALSCVKHDISLYFIGAKPGVADNAAHNLKEKVTGIEISGTHHGYFNKSVGSQENRSIIEEINSSDTNILLVGFGMPLQEYWINENLEHLNINVAVPVGALFDFMAADVYRAPRWITDRGFEWFTRMLIEPRRLWKRYVIGNPLFFWRVLMQRFGLLTFD